MINILPNKGAPPKRVKFGRTPDDESEVNWVDYKRPNTLGEAGLIDMLAQRMATDALRKHTGNKKATVEGDVSGVYNILATIKMCVKGIGGVDFEGITYTPDIWENMPTTENMWWLERVFEAIGDDSDPVEPKEKTATDPKG